jgi:hypothetical protein
MGEHRVPMLGAALRRRVDPAKSRDPQVRALVAALSTLEVAPPPRPDFRTELRAQLVAVTPRLVEEGKAELEQAGAAARNAQRADRAAESAESARRLHLKKPLIAVAGVLTAFVLLLGGAVLISQNALPGDALYGLKRASENTEYSLAGGAVDRGKLKLEFAGNRIGEVGDLLSHAGALGAAVGAVADGGQLNAHTASLVRQTLGSANGDVLTASKLLTGAAVASRSTAPLDNITSWSGGQAAAMRQIVARLDGTALQSRAAHTLSLILGAGRHANALRHELGCTCLDSAPPGIYGPAPCSPCSSGKPGRSGHSGQPGSSKQSGTPGTGPGSTKSSAPGPHPASSSTGNGPHPAPRRSSTAPGAPPSSSSGAPLPRSSGPSTPKIVIPTTLPITAPGGGQHSKTHHPAPTLPVGVSSCASFSLGPIGIGIGHC